MSDEAQTVEAEANPNPISDMIQHALDQDFNKANEVFGELLTVKLGDVLDQEKARMADVIYNNAGSEENEEEPEEDADEEQLDLDLDDPNGDEGDDEEFDEEDSEEDTSDDEEEVIDQEEEEEVEV